MDLPADREITFGEAKQLLEQWQADVNRFPMWKMRFTDAYLWLQPRYVGEARAAAQLRKVAARDLIVRIARDPLRCRVRMKTLTTGLIKDLHNEIEALDFEPLRSLTRELCAEAINRDMIQMIRTGERGDLGARMYTALG